MSPSLVYLCVKVRISGLAGNVRGMSSSLDLGQGPFLQDDDVSFHGIVVEIWEYVHGPVVILASCLWRRLCRRQPFTQVSWELFSGMWLRTLIACPNDSAKIMIRASLEGCLGFDFGSRN